MVETSAEAVRFPQAGEYPTQTASKPDPADPGDTWPEKAAATGTATGPSFTVTLVEVGLGKNVCRQDFPFHFMA